MREYRGLLGPVFVVLLFLIAVRWSPFEPHRDPVGVIGPTGPQDAVATPASPAAAPWADEDWNVFESKVRWAAQERLDTLSIGSLMAELGRSFVGTAYIPQTLEVEGPERLVINFRGLDCVTFVENMLAMARFVHEGGAERVEEREATEAAYGALLREVRYRDGRIDGYPSRLHYFADWVADNDRRGLVSDVTAELGGVLDKEPIDFMTKHPQAYSQLGDPSNLTAVRSAEERLTATGRHFVPQDEIALVASGIQDGDIIAATSTVEGLDVAHAGLALWVDGTLRLLHAPLVGDSVQISEVTLAERIQRADGQDGIIVARPVER